MGLLRARFTDPVDAFAQEFISCVDVDHALIPHDIRGSIAHARMLATRGVLTEKEGVSLISALEKILQEYRDGKFTLDEEFEDVHMNVEEKLGKLGAKLHAGRSRNDQVALDLRLALKQEIRDVLQDLLLLQTVLKKRALEHSKTVLPGVTHLQHAQPVVFGHVLLSFREALERDYTRLADGLKRADVSPLGAAALAGTSLPIDPKQTAEELGFSRYFANSIDAVSDRDFVAEFVFDCSMVMTHLSQIAENLILWSTPEFGFVELPDALCTSSSIMPQKKNPDLVELVRGKTGSVFGELINVLTTLKALPLGYNRDLQETKPPIFQVSRTTRRSLQAVRLAIDGLIVHATWMRKVASDYQLCATDVAEYLTAKGVPFREAHEAVARLMKHCSEKNLSPVKMRPADLQSFHPALEADVYALFTPEASVASRKSPGGTAPENVERSVARS